MPPGTCFLELFPGNIMLATFMFELPYNRNKYKIGSGKK